MTIQRRVIQLGIDNVFIRDTGQQMGENGKEWEGKGRVHKPTKGGKGGIQMLFAYKPLKK